MRPLVVGEAPSRTSDPADPITGRCGAKIAALAGLTVDEFADRFERANLLDAYPGKLDGSKGTLWDPISAKKRADEIVGERFGASRYVVLLGRRVATAFGVGRVDYMEETAAIRGAAVVVLPHPSGINRWYNDARNVARASAFMKRIARRSKDESMPNSASIALAGKAKKTRDRAADEPAKPKRARKTKSDRRPTVEKQYRVEPGAKFGKASGVMAVNRRVVRIVFDDGKFVDLKPAGYKKDGVVAVRDAAVEWLSAALGL